MSTQITIDLPDDAFSVLRSRPEDFVKEMRLAAAVKWLELGLVSQSKAAELAGVSRRALYRPSLASGFPLSRKRPKSFVRPQIVHRKWVVNSSPLIILGKLSSLYLPEKMCPNLVIPEGVAHELDHEPVNDQARAWIHLEGASFVRAIDKKPPLIMAWDLGKGETEVISWAYVHSEQMQGAHTGPPLPHPHGRTVG